VVRLLRPVPRHTAGTCYLRASGDWSRKGRPIPTCLSWPLTQASPFVMVSAIVDWAAAMIRANSGWSWPTGSRRGCRAPTCGELGGFVHFESKVDPLPRFWNKYGAPWLVGESARWTSAGASTGTTIGSRPSVSRRVHSTYAALCGRASGDVT
jgi:hypothetical protein